MLKSKKRPFRELVNKENNEEPVVYCRKCLSLKIMSYPDMDDFCDDCGSTDLAETDIFTWEKMYREKYNNEHIEV